MAILSLCGVLLDGSTPVAGSPASPSVQPLSWPQGEDGQISIAVIRSGRLQANLTGGTLILAVRKRWSDADPLVSRQATFTDAAHGLAVFAIGSADTLSLDPAERYTVDVQYVDTEGKRSQVVPASKFDVVEIEARPGEAVTVPASQQPLGQGPPGPAGALFSVPGDWTDDTGSEALVSGFPVVALNFDDLTPDPLQARISGVAASSAGTAHIYLRVGGTATGIDGTIWVTADITGSEMATFQKAGTGVKPSGLQPVKMTFKSSGSGKTVEIAGAAVSIIGTPLV